MFGEVHIVYKPRITLKTQMVADFVVEFTSPELTRGLSKMNVLAKPAQSIS